MWFKTENGWKDVNLPQFVRPGVPWVEHPNRAVASHIYSEILALGVFIHAPEKGREVVIRYPLDVDPQIRQKIKELALHVGFNGIIGKPFEKKQNNEFVLTVIIDEG